MQRKIQRHRVTMEEVEKKTQEIRDANSPSFAAHVLGNFLAELGIMPE